MDGIFFAASPCVEKAEPLIYYSWRREFPNLYLFKTCYCSQGYLKLVVGKSGPKGIVMTVGVVVSSAKFEKIRGNSIRKNNTNIPAGYTGLLGTININGFTK